MEQSPSWEANQSLQLVKKFPAFLLNPVPATCPYPEPTPSSPHHPLQLHEDPLSSTILRILIWYWVFFCLFCRSMDVNWGGVKGTLPQYFFYVRFVLFFHFLLIFSVGRDSSVGIATRYGLDGPGIESRWGRDFPHPSKPAVGPTQPPTLCVLVFSRGKAAGAWRSAEVKERLDYTSTLPLGLRGPL
jgi:hypothetical protein